MDSRIFSLGLSDKAITLYLLIDCMISSGSPPTEKACRRNWTGSNDEYLSAYVELGKAGVVAHDGQKFFLTSSSGWIRKKQPSE